MAGIVLLVLFITTDSMAPRWINPVAEYFRVITPRELGDSEDLYYIFHYQ